MLKFPFKGILAFLCLGISLSVAQNTLTEVKVSALKLPQKEADVARDMTILPDSVIQRFQGLGLSELLSRQAGIQILGTTQTPGSIKTTFLRGSSSSQVLILIDGVPVYEPSAIGSSFDLNLINLSQVERIEILRGGNSTLYGSDAMAGVINIITRKNQESVFHPSLQVGGGSFGQWNSALGVSGKTEKEFEYSLTGMFEKSLGITSAYVEGGDAEKDGYQNAQVEARLNQAFGKWSLGLFGNLKNYRSDLDAGAFADETDFTFESGSAQIGGSARFAGKNSLGNVQVSHLFIDRKYLNDSLQVLPTAFDLYSESTYGSKQTFMDASYSFKPVSQLDLLVGADYRNQQMNQSYYSVSSYGEYRDPDIDRETARIDNASIYLSAQSIWGGHFGLDLGGRLNHHSVYGMNSSFQLNPYVKFGNELVFLNVASSFRNPALYELFSPYGNEDLGPEKGISYEIGWKGNRNGLASYNLTLFSRKVSDQISFQSLSEAPYGTYLNLGQERVNGADLNLVLQFAGFRSSTNYTYLNGFVYKSGEGFNKTDLLRKPQNMLNLSLDRQIGDRWNAGLHTRFTGKRTDRYYDSAVFEQKELELKSYWLLNASASFAVSSRLSVQGFVNNLLNVSYQEIVGYASRPFNFNLGLIYR